VTLLENGVPTDKSFRVLFKGIPGTVERADDLNALVKREAGSAKATNEPLPLCLFVFTMGDDRGYYGWIEEPVPSAPGGLRRRKLAEVCWRTLDEKGMAEIVASVNTWYDAQRQAQAA